MEGCHTQEAYACCASVGPLRRSLGVRGLGFGGLGFGGLGLGVGSGFGVFGLGFGV